MTKIMLVLENQSDRDFLEKVLERLSFVVITMKKDVNFSEQLIDHFPDLVFAATLGKNQKILSALAKIKEARGKPKLVFVRQERESQPLNPEQKKVIDGVLYSPIDPFKLIEVLANTTTEDIGDLRHRYNQMLQGDGGKGAGGNTVVADGPAMAADDEPIHVSGGGYAESERENKSRKSQQGDNDFEIIKGGHSSEDLEAGSDEPSTKEAKLHVIKDSPEKKTSDSPLIYDEARKKKYEQICAGLGKIDRESQVLDSKSLRQKQKLQAEQVTEAEDVKKNRKHFIKTLFSMDVEAKKKA